MKSTWRSLGPDGGRRTGTTAIVLLLALLVQPQAYSQNGTVALTLKGTCDLWDFDRAYAWDVSVAGDYAYVACSWGGLLVIDVHDSAQPQVIGALMTDYQTQNVRVRGRYAYLTDFRGGLRIIDVSDPPAPKLVATWNTVGGAVGICLVGDYAYVSTHDSALDPACRRALEIVDVSDPEHPTQAGCFYTDDSPNGVAVVGNYAYLANGALQVIDISNPARPFLAGVFKNWDGYCHVVRVIGDYAYVGGNVWDPGLERDVGFLRVLNVTDPTRPVETGRCSVDFISLVELEVVGNYAYVPAAQWGLEVIDVSNPSKPVRAATFKAPDATHSNATLAVQVVGNTVYLASETYFHVAEIAFPLRLDATVLPGNTLRLSWPGGVGVRLQKAAVLVNPDWQDVPGTEGVNSLEFPMTEAMGFFRAVQQ
jgi:hypothetical protein